MDEGRRNERNLVLIGMPSAGKTTVGQLLAQALDRPLADCDRQVEARLGMPIAQFFREEGEAAFRKVERAVVEQLARGRGQVIATGGGAVLDPRNMEDLMGAGTVYWLDRPLPLLVTDPSRPLAPDRAALERIYHARRELYQRYGQVRIPHEGTAQACAQAILLHWAAEGGRHG